MSTRILIGDCRDVLKTLPDASVHCCVTSPPYFNLRNYGMDAQIGLEPTPYEFVAELVDVFREVRRVLRDDATLWLNLGDSYSGAGGATPGKRSDGIGQADTSEGLRRVGRDNGMKNKDLLGIPWMVAFALRADGWWLRQDIIFSKPNPMPESVTDRCTKSHEYVFLLSKSQRYFFDAKAIAEPCVGQNEHDLTGPGYSAPGQTAQTGTRRLAGNVNPPKGQAAYEAGDERHRTKAGLLDYAVRERSKRDSFKRDDSKRAEVFPGQTVGTHRPDRKESDYPTATRNKRSVWTIATKPYSEAHFAVMAPELAETCIKAGCPVGGTVLDPFGGAGTTGLVADQLQRNSILIELNPDYVKIAERRITGDAPMFTEVSCA